MPYGLLIWSKKVRACFVCVVFGSGKTSYVVMLCFSGSYWRRAEPVGRDPEAKLGQDIAAPRTFFRTWSTIDRGHWTEIVVWKRCANTLNATLKER